MFYAAHMKALSTISIASPAGQASLTSFGAHVVQWHPADEADVLWVSSQAAMNGSRAIRGGIPICLPWFSDPAASPTTPGAGAGAHGLARTSLWQLRSAVQPAGGAPASATLDFTHVGETSPIFPHSFTATLDVLVSDVLTLNLTLSNTDDHVFSIEAALHTYFSVGDVKDAIVEGLSGARYWDNVRHRYSTQVGDVTFVGPTDRTYTSSEQLRIIDPRLHRRINVDKSGSGSTIVWNPWAAGAQELPDMGNDEWQDFVCVEVGAVRERALTLWPGSSHIMTASISVDALE